MKTFRILLLVMLAMLLPLRGALADIAHCAGSSGDLAATAVVQLHSDVHASGGQHGDYLLDSAHAGHHNQNSDTGERAFGSVDACTLCIASCSAIPFLNEPLASAFLLPIAAAPYPVPNAPPPSHASEGPERPPRNA